MCNAGPCFAQHSFCTSLLCESGVLYPQDAINKVLLCPYAKGDGCHSAAGTVSFLRQVFSAVNLTLCALKINLIVYEKCLLLIKGGKRIKRKY